MIHAFAIDRFLCFCGFTNTIKAHKSNGEQFIGNCVSVYISTQQDLYNFANLNATALNKVY